LFAFSSADRCDQENALQWERVDPPWVLPDYVEELAEALWATKAWIMTGGPATPMTVVTDMRAPTAQASDGESEAQGSVGSPDEELPTLRQLLPKVLQSDQVKHTLYKGAWATTPATHPGWRIFVAVSGRRLSAPLC